MRWIPQGLPRQKGSLNSVAKTQETVDFGTVLNVHGGHIARDVALLRRYFWRAMTTSKVALRQARCILGRGGRLDQTIPMQPPAALQIRGSSRPPIRFVLVLGLHWPLRAVLVTYAIFGCRPVGRRPWFVLLRWLGVWHGPLSQGGLGEALGLAIGAGPR